MVGLEGTATEVAWMQETLAAEWAALDTPVARCFSGGEATELWARLTEFPAIPAAALVLRATTLPSAVTTFAANVLELVPGCSLQSHAGNGVTILRLAEYPAEGLARMLLARLVPWAAKSKGNVTILSNSSGAEMTKQSVWSGIEAPYDLMTDIKRQFDPADTLNPGRFVYT
jgi:FAD/FMN-containing dehydrogenase